MLDGTLFSISLPDIKRPDKTSALIISGCSVHINDENYIYSEFDELNFCSLNSNDYENGKISIEIEFENTFEDPYFIFYAQCFTIRVSTGLVIKTNKCPYAKMTNNYSKVNKNGKVVLGFEYYFKTDDEYNKILNCKVFCIEGFIAVNKKSNVYGFVCKTQKDNEWIMQDGNTYRIYKYTNIDDLFH